MKVIKAEINLFGRKYYYRNQKEVDFDIQILEKLQEVITLPQILDYRIDHLIDSLSGDIHQLGDDSLQWICEKQENCDDIRETLWLISVEDTEWTVNHKKGDQILQRKILIRPEIQRVLIQEYKEGIRKLKDITIPSTPKKWRMKSLKRISQDLSEFLYEDINKNQIVIMEVNSEELGRYYYPKRLSSCSMAERKNLLSEDELSLLNEIL